VKRDCDFALYCERNLVERFSMVFVVSVLEQFFHMTSDAACELMLRVHHEGSAVCGTYSHEEATRLVDDVSTFALPASAAIRHRP
jgi:ATP-dependent Clp protease adapter protein ClpS